MARTPDKTPDRDRAHGRFIAGITNRIDSGEHIPCTHEQHGRWWTSDQPRDQEAAAWLCGGCPALDACRSYVDAHPERSGVWAGRPPLEKTRTTAA